MITKDVSIKDVKIIENIRAKDTQENIPELMQSIKDNGLLQPIGLKEEHIGYTLIWGYRRLSACKKLGWKTIPAVIFLEKDEEMNEEEFFILNATENIQRRQNTLLEFGRVCKILGKTLSSSEIAKRLSVPKTRVDSALTEMSRLPKKWQSRVRFMEGGGKDKAGDIPLTTASMVGSLRGVTTEQKDNLLEHISVNESNKMEVTAMASLMKGGITFNQAKKKIENYKTISFKLLVDKKKYDELRKNYKTEVEFLVNALNKFANDETFCFKIADKRSQVTNTEIQEILKKLSKLKRS